MSAFGGKADIIQGNDIELKEFWMIDKGDDFANSATSHGKVAFDANGEIPLPGPFI